jgi:hypothetical protein
MVFAAIMGMIGIAMPAMTAVALDAAGLISLAGTVVASWCT